MWVLGEPGEFWSIVAGAELEEAKDGAMLGLEVDDYDQTLWQAIGLGAWIVAEHPYRVLLSSPSGVRFWLAPWRGGGVRLPLVTAPDLSTSRLDQVCLDLGPVEYHAEVGFWSRLTGWQPRRGSLPEFTFFARPAGVPIRILLQLLGEDRPASAHLDFACSDPEATRAWHESLGAQATGSGPRWIVMRSPSGGVYCLTGRDPETGVLPH